MPLPHQCSGPSENYQLFSFDAFCIIAGVSSLLNSQRLPRPLSWYSSTTPVNLWLLPSVCGGAPARNAGGRSPRCKTIRVGSQRHWPFFPNREILMKHASNINTVTLAALVLLAFPTPVYARAREVPSVVSVSLPGGGTVDIRLDNFENPLKSAGNKTLLAVHGLAHTGATFRPLANELFKRKDRNQIGRVLAINFPGRNGSEFPSKPRFGELTVEDYTAILLGVLDQLPRQLNIETLVGHSMGGLIVQTAQHNLRAAGSSLEKAYGIKNVYLLAPSIPSPLPWLFAESGVVLKTAADIIAVDSRLGSYLRVLSSNPVEQRRRLGIWLGLFFRNRAGQFVAGTPFTTALQSNYVSNEALVMTLQVLGANGFARPFVHSGIFSKRAQKCFRIVTFSEDLSEEGENLLQEIQNLSSYLTGNAHSRNVVFIEAPDAVHDMFIINPAKVARVLASCA
jgi:pimeloyl-ACP methyl ester carboxylesterase